MSAPAYPAYKESGLDWLGCIPEHWQITRLKYLGKSIIGLTYDPSQIVDIGSGSLVLRSSNVQKGKIALTDNVYVVSTIPPDLITREGDILICSRNGSRDLIGKNATIDALSAGMTFGAFMTVFRSQHNRYVGWLLNSPLFEFQSGAFLTSTINQLTVGVLNNFEVPLPPEAERKKIAAFLDRETGKIDALVGEQERLIALLKEKRQAVISQAVTKGLNPTVPMKHSGVEWLGEVPAHWDVKRLKQVAQVRGGVAKGRDLSGATTIRVPYLRVANVQDGYLDLTEVTEIEILPEELDRYRLRSGDVLMNEGGDFDKLGRGYVWRGEISDCIHQNHVFSVRPYSISPDWLSLVTSSDAGRFFFMGRSKQSTNLASISASNLAELPFGCPPSEECQSILSAIRTTLAHIAGLIEQAERAIALLRERRAALIAAAVTGKVDVREYVDVLGAQAA